MGYWPSSMPEEEKKWHMDHSAARAEHAFILKTVDKMKYEAIGYRLGGVSKARVCQMLKRRAKLHGQDAQR